MSFEFVDNHIEITPPKKPKKLTGTRFATVLGRNHWSTPFEVWCEITRTYQKPFEDTIYTVAGKVIEPKQAEYMKKSYFMPNIVTPTDLWGKDYFKKTYGDFFPDSPVLGGMWDYVLKDKNGHFSTVLEMKTTKRVEDWQDDVPEYYALQAALYAYLLKVDDVIMVCSFLADSDYDNPDNFVPTANNTITKSFKVSERYPNFVDDYVLPALKWWNEYVMTGKSPDFDESNKTDAEILKVLHKYDVDLDDDLQGTLAEAEQLKAEIDANSLAIKDKEKRYKEITDKLKKASNRHFDDPGINSVEWKGSKYVWNYVKSVGTELDTEKLKADGLYEKYLIPKTSYKLTCKEIK